LKEVFSNYDLMKVSTINVIITFKKGSMMSLRLDELKELVSKKSGLLLYFTGEGCRVCHSLKPKIDALFREKFPEIERIFLDAHKQREISAYFGVFSVPTILVFLDGKEFMREGRATSLTLIEKRLSRPYQILMS
jgi:thiol-disulfide isomerase/thioredoxin